jgi:hypothetical protein
MYTLTSSSTARCEGIGPKLSALALAMQYGLFCDHGLIQYQVTGLAFST